MRKRARLTAFALAVVCACALPGLSQEKGNPAKPAPKDDDFPLGVLGLAQEVKVSAAMHVFAARDPVACAGLRIAAVCHPVTEELLSPEWDLWPNRPYPLSVDHLEALRDGTRIAPANKPAEKWTPDEKAFAAIRLEALVKSDLVYRQGRPELFEKEAEENGHVTFDHLFGQPEAYRGKIVPVKGRMIRLRQFDTTRDAQVRGVEAVYEAWILGETPKRPPYWVLFTRLPEGLTPQETMNRPVRFYGYFIKRVSYQAEKTFKDTVILIGPTVYLEPVPAKVESSPFTKDILIAALAGLLTLGVTIAFLMLWFRRGDRKIHQRLAALRDQPLNLGEDAVAETAMPQPETGVKEERQQT